MRPFIHPLPSTVYRLPSLAPMRVLITLTDVEPAVRLNAILEAVPDV
jgi:hypothetical protein